VVAQTQAGLTRMLLDELFAVRTASVEALIGARHQADTLYESVVFAVGGVATLPDCLRGGRTPSPRAVHNVLLRDYFTSHAFSAVLFVVDGSKNHGQDNSNVPQANESASGQLDSYHKQLQNIQQTSTMGPHPIDLRRSIDCMRTYQLSLGRSCLYHC